MDLSALPHPFTRRDAAAAGIGRRALDEALRLGWVVRLRRGWYAAAGATPLDTGDELWQRTVQAHLELVREHLRRFPGHAASHTSAALVHGLGVMVAPQTPVELTALDRRRPSGREAGLVLHHADSADTAYEEIDGIRVTTLARTVADTARTRRLPHGTALLDEVLRTGRLSEQEVLAALDDQRRWRGRPRALVALELSDTRRETWVESYSDVRLLELGVPLPVPQVWIYDEDGRPVAKVDGIDAALGIAREADGHGKYFMDMALGLTPEASVLRRLAAEQVRQQRLEGLGLRLLRWTTPQIRLEPEQIASRWMTLSRAPVPPISAYVEWEGELRRLPFEMPMPEVDLEKARTSRRQRWDW